MGTGHPLHRLIVHSSEVNLSKFKMLTRWYRIGSSRSSKNKKPLVPEVRWPLLWRDCVGFPRFTCDFVPTVHSFVRAATLLQALKIVCVVFQSICTTFEIVSCFLEMMLCGLMILACSTEATCQTSCPEPPLQTANANHHLRRCFFQRFSSCCQTIQQNCVEVLLRN